MLQYLARRSAYMLLILLLSSVGVFYSLRFAPGDPSGVAVSAFAREEVREEYRRRSGLDQPIYKQYFVYMGNLFQGDLGASLITGKGMGELLKNHGKNSLILGFAVRSCGGSCQQRSMA